MLPKHHFLSSNTFCQVDIFKIIQSLDPRKQNKIIRTKQAFTFITKQAFHYVNL